MTRYCFDIKTSLIEPALVQAGLNHPGLAELLSAIALTEQGHSEPGRFGPFAMTASQHQAVWDEYIARSPELACQVRGLASQRRFLADPHQELTLNWGYATIMAALLCLYHSEGKLPDLHRADEATRLWKNSFRSRHDGKAREFQRHFKQCTKGKHLAA
ncbi:MAG: hypothetical protein ACX931_05155 [Saccharospirillum sp.]